MPVATTSRRKPTLRHQDTDDIEEDRSTQIRNEDVDDSDGDAPRPTKKGKKSNGKQKVELQDSDGDGNDDGEGEDEDEEDEIIDVTNFRNQPLKRDDAHGMQGLAEDWGLLDKVSRNNWKMVRDIAVAIADASEDGGGEKDLADLDMIMRELIDISVEMGIHADVVNDIRQKIVMGGDVDDVVDQYFAGLKVKKKEYTGKTTRQKYAKNEGYLEFKSGIWEVLQPDAPMPPLTSLIEREDGDDSDDDDLEIGGRTQDYKCPLTMTLLVNPVTSSVCGHSYSADAIKEIFKSKATIRCPASGCQKAIKLSDCKADKELAKKVKARQRRLAQQEDNSDEAEEIID